MPDEPTMEEMMRVIELYVPDYAGPTPYPWRVMKAAIRARIERKVSREWVRKWTRLIDINPYRNTMKEVIAMLKELGYEVDNA